MSTTLYRKYRPQLFADVVGQDHITKTLLNQIKSGNIAHAYLFAGPRGIGKTTTARLLAKALNAHDPQTGEPDNDSLINKAITEGRSLDLVEIDAASNRRIEEVRELREHVKYPPNQAKYKVFIIDEVHMLTTEAFNALLKTLEEPPSYVVFILATTDIQKLPDTIVSRCQRFDFKKVTPQVLETRLRNVAQAEGVVVAAPVLKTIIKLSEGCVRDAESLLGQILSIGEKNITEKEAGIFLPKSNVLWLEKFWQVFVELDNQKGIEIIAELVEAGVDIEFFYNDWLELLRLVLVWKINPTAQETVYVVNEEIAENIKKTLDNFTVKNIREMIDIFIHYKNLQNLTPLPQMTLELATVEVISKLSNKDDSSSEGDLKTNNNKNSEDVKSDTNHKKTRVTNAVVESFWPQVLNNMSQKNPSLAQYLKSAQIKLDKNILEIVVGHTFHYEIIKKPQHLNLITDFIINQINEKISIKIRLDEQVKSEIYQNNTIVDKFLDTFGGKVINEGNED